jgi:hypothetical protein
LPLPPIPAKYWQFLKPNQYFKMIDPIFMPPPEWVREWTKELLNKETSKGEACRSIVRKGASYGFNKGLTTGHAMGAASELEWCCAQISQCHLIPPELRPQVAEYLHEIRSKPTD